MLRRANVKGKKIVSKAIFLVAFSSHDKRSHNWVIADLHQLHPVLFVWRPQHHRLYMHQRTPPSARAERKYSTLLYSWRFTRYSAPIHLPVHGHMTSNNETVPRQMPWADNTVKTMTSNGKRFTVTREMLTAAAHDQRRLQGWCCRWNLSAFLKICSSFVLLYNKSLNDWPLGEQNALFPSGPAIECQLWQAWVEKRGVKIFKIV